MPSSAHVSKLVSLAALVLVGVALAGCGGSKHKPAITPTSSPRDQWGTVWLCRPSETDDPCTSDLATTVVKARGATHIERASPSKTPPIDCFYVYPTISEQPTINANLDIGFREREIAIAQASRFSQVCKVYAPVYRQITLSALEHPSRITLADALIAYRGVLAAFRDYLAHYNDRRGIVVIGHSQGATILIRLLEQEVDRKPTVRSRLVSALLMGGNVTVPKGQTVGGDFAHIPACASSRQTGCVVAYSSFTTKPPRSSEFGRTTSDAGVNLLAPRNPSPNIQIMCVNPAAPSGGTAVLDPYIPSLILAFLPAGSAPPAKTPWVSFPDEYTARCESSGNAAWLQITHIADRTDHRPFLTRLQDPALGLHILDLNIALGNLVQLVREESAAYHHS
jgi:pimeloyl-ACP methyl ester carboxylesterase